MLVVTFFWLAASTASIEAKMNEAQPGYRDCNLHHLGACANSNQLFFGPFRKGPAKRKLEISIALRSFLKDAPKTYATISGQGVIGSDTANNAEEEFVGPDGAPEQLPSGEWLFRGFEPHASPFSAYVMFNATGHILLVGMVETGRDTPNFSERSADYVLRIYSRSGEPNKDIVARWQSWARDAVGDKSQYPGVLPPNRFVGTEIFMASGKKWSSHWLGH